ncbi:MAG: DNA alkylation repair protein [Firmicutes bacterium]|nr:DNA alkylation repair protein [Bacillota bacterium]
MKNKMTIVEEIRKELFALQDVPYRDFQVKLFPGCDVSRFIGVRTPALRSLAKEYGKREDAGVFLGSLPHAYFDEDQLHAFILEGVKDFGRCMDAVEAFLPYVDNWATCDQLSPKAFRKEKTKLLERIKVWLGSDRTYTVRFAIGMLMQHFLDEDFGPDYPEMVAEIRSDEYYINMMIAWYFATALAKRWDDALPYLQEHRLDPWTHNKAIQKAVESRRITPEQKEYLRSLKVKA